MNTGKSNNRKKYYAKSIRPDGHQPTVKEHLERVSCLAAEYGREIGCEEEARLAGLFHDFGKYSDSFQRKLTGKKGDDPGVDHEICGASILRSSLAKKLATPSGFVYRSVIEAISGHHSSLSDFADIEETLKHNMESEKKVERNGRFSALSGKPQYREAMRAFGMDFPGYKIPFLAERHVCGPGAGEVERMLFSRMLFSCLVDADYSVSATDDNPLYMEETEGIPFDPAEMLEKLYVYKEGLRKNSSSDKTLNWMREMVFDICGEAGEGNPEGLFTLTAPTGVGKTLALLHFALRHCLATGKKRIIIVLPFLSLTEQTADTYLKIFPYILEDNSQKDLSDQERQYAARWSAPLVVTTSVRFFETLFACRPTDCRKLHHIANSVVIFDESQSLPPDVTSSTLKAVNSLCRDYHCTMVFSTATQPDFSAIPQSIWEPVEILPKNRVFYENLKRTRVEWRTDRKQQLSDIASEMAGHSSVCAIVNLRRHAKKLYKQLKETAGPDGTYLITTDLCPDHRRECITQIKERLAAGLPCRVVATQCIEAGVDLDFDVMYRALAPLESIIQAAGRCNRNGTLDAPGLVVVFIPDEEGRLYPGTWYGNSAQKVIYLIHIHGLDIHDPQHIQEYYCLVYSQQKDIKELTQAIQNREYEDVDASYKLIRNEGCRVIVPWKGNLVAFEQVRKEALDKGLTPLLIHRAAGFTVSARVPEKQLEMVAEPLFYRRYGQKDTTIHSNFYIIRYGHEDLYADDTGLHVPDAGGMEVFL